MKIIRVDEQTANQLAPLVSDFRVTLQGFRGIVSKPDLKAAKEEIADFLKAGFPVFAALDGGEPAGYVVCRLEGGCLWVEQLYVCGDRRRNGIASALFDKAEELAREMGEETVFNYVHPNNDAVISFLRSKGYTVLNLIEIRKSYSGEKLCRTIDVNGHSVDY